MENKIKLPEAIEKAIDVAKCQLDPSENKQEKLLNWEISDRTYALASEKVVADLGGKLNYAKLKNELNVTVQELDSILKQEKIKIEFCDIHVQWKKQLRQDIYEKITRTGPRPKNKIKKENFKVKKFKYLQKLKNWN